MKKKFIPPKVCPICGEDVPPNSLACPECGADERTGWKEDAHTYDGLDLPDDDFDYDDYVKTEFGAPEHQAAAKGLWWFVAVAVLILLAWIALHGG